MSHKKKASRVHLALFFKDFAAWCRSSCVGLNVAGFTTAQVLRQQGVDVVVYPVRHNIDIVEDIERYNDTHEEPLTHVAISAPWLSEYDVECLAKVYPDITFVILSHSNVGFLQADPDGVYLLRNYCRIGKEHPNLRIGGNSSKFTEWFEQAYREDIVFLPNLYPMENCKDIKHWDGQSALKIGAFGAVRPYKNFMTAAAAALSIQQTLQVPVEFHMSAGGEGDGWQTIPAIEQLLANTGVTLVLHEWSYWDAFIQLVSKMDLMIQVSYTESFNMVTADGVFVGVPSVVSSAITWAPESWMAEVDDALDVARVGVQLLTNPNNDGRRALKRHNDEGIRHWFRFLRSHRENFAIRAYRRLTGQIAYRDE